MTHLKEEKKKKEKGRNPNVITDPILRISVILMLKSVLRESAQKKP